MPRSKTLPDADVLAAALRIVNESGPDALTFASVSRGCGLSSSTLVQRFGSKNGLMQSTLLHAWDRLDEKTGQLAASMPNTPQGAIEMLVALSGEYGGIETYADGLLILREDLRDPVLRARGAAWKQVLIGALAARFADVRGAPPDIGLLMASQWQGSLLWWGFEPRGTVERFVADGLRRFIAAIVDRTGADCR